MAINLATTTLEEALDAVSLELIDGCLKSVDLPGLRENCVHQVSFTGYDDATVQFREVVVAHVSIVDPNIEADVSFDLGWRSGKLSFSLEGQKARHFNWVLRGGFFVFTEILPKVGILWNGGWDDYLVDPESVRDMTPEELEKTNEGNSRFFPTFQDMERVTWIKGKFLQSEANQKVAKVGEYQCVRSKGRIAGGD